MRPNSPWQKSDRPCTRDLAAAGKARRGGDARASSTTSNAVRRRQTPGALRVAGGPDPSALLRLLDDAWASPASRRLQHGLSDFCHGLLSPRSEDHGSHRGLAQFRREPAGSPHCIVVRDAKAWPLISWSLRDGGLSGTSPSCRHRGHRCGFPIWSAGVHFCWHRMPRMRHGKLELDLAFGKIRCHWVKARVVEGNVAPARIRGKGGYRLIEG